MFTGIIETTGVVKEANKNGSNKTFWIKSAVSAELNIDQSVSHNGVCLTVEEIINGMHRVTAINETLAKTNLNQWQPGTMVNIERCLQMNGRLDGHIVQGHTDTTGVCTDITAKDGSWEYNISINTNFASLIIEKGSIALNGISLTIFNVLDNGFTVAIIPYTYQHTNMQKLAVAERVNIEFDMIGKYVTRMMQLR